jgi:hypothetical protein
VAALESLPRWWLSLELPGYRPEPEDGGTYSAFPYGDLPPVPELDDDLAWLLEAPPVPESLAEAANDRHPAPARTATAQQLEELLGETSLRLPRSFRTFVASHQLRSRIRSATYCYLDLGELLVPVGEGGALVHFLSDQQWVLHWLLYCDADGRQCVVVSDVPFGFHGDEDPVGDFDPTGNDSAVCAESFSEFLYRFWIENEIWFALEEEDRPLSAAEQAYVDHYAALGR